MTALLPSKKRGPLPNAHILLAAIFLIGAPLPSLAQSAGSVTFNFPSEMAGFVAQKQTTYPNQALGKSVRYQRAETVADVYFYNRGQDNIPDGSRSDLVRSELDQSAAEIKKLADLGLYKSARKLKAFSVGKAGFACQSYALTAQRGQLNSILCLRGAQGIFVKIRISGPASDRSFQPQAMKFIESWNVIASYGRRIPAQQGI